MKHRRLICLASLVCILTLALVAPRLTPRAAYLPGHRKAERSLVRVWIVSSPGGGESWLRACLQAWEKQHPEMHTYLRVVSAGELSAPGAVMPDVVLYMPGDVTAPQQHFSPLSGITGIRGELLRAGRWQLQQYGLPLCYAAYALAIDAQVDSVPVQTPAPTTLLGRPAATAAPPSATPAIPALETVAVSAGCALLALGSLFPPQERPAPADPAVHSSADVYHLFHTRQASAALLTTGQITALEGQLPFRAVVPEAIVTDQVWMASILPGAQEQASMLLQHLISAGSQRLLSQQGLHTVREDLRLYASGTPMQVEASAARALVVINAYCPTADVHSAAWQFYENRITIDAALLPLM